MASLPTVSDAKPPQLVTILPFQKKKSLKVAASLLQFSQMCRAKPMTCLGAGFRGGGGERVVWFDCALCISAKTQFAA